MRASWRGHTAIVKMLLERGASLEMQDKRAGWSALLYAVDYGDEDIIQMLIKSGASLDIQAKVGQ